MPKRYNVEEQASIFKSMVENKVDGIIIVPAVNKMQEMFADSRINDYEDTGMYEINLGNYKIFE